jgi:hypothetical protein
MNSTAFSRPEGYTLTGALRDQSRAKKGLQWNRQGAGMRLIVPTSPQGPMVSKTLTIYTLGDTEAARCTKNKVAG